MHDPFPIAPIPWLSRAVQPFADWAGFVTLPLHIHEVLISFCIYTWINLWFAPRLSTWLFPVRYPALSAEKKLNWDVHVVSLSQSLLINTLALWVMYADEERAAMDWQGRIWGYTGAAGMIQAMAQGYFLWDLMVTVWHLPVFGIGMLAHAISSLTVFSFGFRPFVNFYACTFILYELSSPFLNIHWFFDKLDMTGTLPQLCNGIALLITFFCCRLVWGTYQSLRVYQDMWAALHHVPSLANSTSSTLLGNMDSMNTTAAAIGKTASAAYNETMRFKGAEYVPIWLAVTYLGSNVVLNTLNFFWFGKMIEALKKRFSPVKETKVQGVSRKEKSNGTVTVEADETEVRRRRVKA